jgi:hypothetical protein
MAKRARNPDQADLFEAQELFPVQAPATIRRALDFNRSIAMAMSEAIRTCGKTREAICAEMTELLGYDDGKEMTLAQLNAYTSAARETHTISLVRFVAFARVTDCTWLWEVVLHDEGLTVLEGKEAHFARAAIMRKQGEQLIAAAEAELHLAPSTVRVPRGRK